MARPEVDVDAMSRNQRRRLLEQLWDSLSRDTEAIALTDEQRSELDEGLDALDRDGAIGMSGDEVRAQLRPGSR
jgi:putative addiction module component (TIGR02574 family)